MKNVLAIVALLALAACTSGLDRKFDGSSEQKFETSLEAMKKSAKPEEIAALDDALLVLAITNVSIGYEGGINRSTCFSGPPLRTIFLSAPTMPPS